MKVFLVVAVCLIAANADTVLDKWNEFKITHRKTYKSLLEERRRLAIFKDNLNFIDQHNEKYESGISTFKMGITKFADLTRDEFKSTLGYASSKKSGVKLDMFQPTGSPVNKNIDYVKAGFVTDVKDQGDCGSCWAFSVAGAVEGQVAKDKKILKSLSAQNLLDCLDKNNDGCHGGDLISAFEYIKEYGILDDDEYPYLEYRHRCTEKGGRKVSNLVQVPAKPEAALEALAKIGPLSMVLDATDLQHYAHGIIDGHGSCKHDEDHLNHGVLMVGAGTEGETDYFLVKNSWGAYWGPYQGYFKIKRTENTCGCLLEVLYAKLQN